MKEKKQRHPEMKLEVYNITIFTQKDLKNNIKFLFMSFVQTMATLQFSEKSETLHSSNHFLSCAWSGLMSSSVQGHTDLCRSPSDSNYI